MLTCPIAVNIHVKSSATIVFMKFEHSNARANFNSRYVGRMSARGGSLCDTRLNTLLILSISEVLYETLLYKD